MLDCHRLDRLMLDAKSLRTPLLWTAYVMLPVSGWGLLHGAPLGLAGAAVLFAIWWTWGVRGPLPGRWLLPALLAARLAGSFLLVAHGFQANYYANERWAPPLEQSTEFRSRTFTRVDGGIAFGVPGAPDFPLYFFNDSHRFNFYQPDQPDRATLPFSVSWHGDIWARENEDARNFFLRAKNLAAELWVDGVLVVQIAPPVKEAFWKAPWPKGRHRVVVRLSSPSGSLRQFEAGFVDPRNNDKIPFGQLDVVAGPHAPWRITADRIVRPLSTLIDTLLFAMLAACFGIAVGQTTASIRSAQRRKAQVALGWLAAIGGGMVVAAPAAGRLIILAGGQDYLSYEHYARDIILDGPLMLLGRRIGQGAPFYFQPLYPYFLALVHLLFGEDLAGVFLIQWLLACLTVFATWKIAADLFGDAIGKTALVLAGMFFAVRLVPLAGVLLNENLFIPLLTCWTLLIIRSAAPSASPRTIVSAGIVGGLGTLARSTLIAGWIVALPVLARARRQAGKRGTAILLMLMIMLGVVSLATLRNWIAARAFVPVTTSVAVNLYLGNQAPAGVPIHPVSEHPLSRVVGGTGYMGMVLEFAHHAPRLFLLNLGNKALYALGLFDALAPGEGVARGLVATWWAALIGMGALMWGRSPDGLPGAIRWLPAVLSFSQFAVVTLVFPNVYGDRLLLPIYILLLPYAALGLIRTIDFLVPAGADTTVQT